MFNTNSHPHLDLGAKECMSKFLYVNFPFFFIYFFTPPFHRSLKMTTPNDNTSLGFYVIFLTPYNGSLYQVHQKKRDCSQKKERFTEKREIHQKKREKEISSHTDSTKKRPVLKVPAGWRRFSGRPLRALGRRLGWRARRAAVANPLRVQPHV